ncbi:MAG: amylo-alpha-1,6-glucosidase [Chloroflexi bacterium]|nr:amylo-alpha-1,6-glucosidase [Chloroflexota bacterium]
MSLHYTPEEKHQRKRRILNHEATALVASIADAVVLKNEDVFFLADPDGAVPLGNHHGFGLYYHDCRFLNGYELKLAGAKPDALASTSAQSFLAAFDLTNHDIQLDPHHFIKQNEIGIRWERTIDSRKLALEEVLTVQNFALQGIEFSLSFTFDSAFEDVFEVRGASPEKSGKLHPPAWKGDVLSFLYDGADGLHRSLSIYFSTAPARKEGTTAHFEVSLEPRERKAILVSLVIAESTDSSQVGPREHSRPDLESVHAFLKRTSNEWLSNQTQVRSDSVVISRILDRSLRDLRVLKSIVGGEQYFAAGVPWFAALFGRDSLITALQTLSYDPGIAEQTLRVLANYQGQKVNDWRDEQPGKILHELRVGEMAHLNEVPQTPYYGSIDSTLLFLLLVSRHAAWTGDLALFQELRNNVERALEWAAKYGDLTGDGYISYKSVSKNGLSNQGWKDSADAIMNADGSLAEPPIALVEVQGYLYAAKLGLADLFARAGDSERAEALRRQAKQLYDRFNQDFWMEDKGFYALALQASKRPASVISSNPGQALWTGIIDPKKAQATVSRLLAPDMFSGWGIRTLSENEKRYNPIGYHLGTVWPHDNSLIAAGFRRYGFDDEATRVFQGMAEGALEFSYYRLPELFSGASREDYGVPVRYPVACHPQAWSAGAMPFLMETLLGLVPEAFDHRLRIVRPILPHAIDHLEIRRLAVGKAHVDLRVERTSDGSIAVNVLKVDGPLDVVVEPRLSS